MHRTRGGMVAAIVLHALHRIASKSLGNPLLAPVPWVMAALSFIAIWLFKLPFPAVVLGAALWLLRSLGLA